MRRQSRTSPRVRTFSPAQSTPPRLSDPAPYPFQELYRTFLSPVEQMLVIESRYHTTTDMDMWNQMAAEYEAQA